MEILFWHHPMKPEGREIVKKLVATADVVVANLPIPTLKAMGIDYDSLKAIKEDIILTMVSAFGGRESRAVFVVLRHESARVLQGPSTARHAAGGTHRHRADPHRASAAESDLTVRRRRRAPRHGFFPVP